MDNIELRDWNKKLYNYLFHYSPYREQWAAIPRGKEVAYFNGDYKNYLKDKDIKELLKKLINGI